MKTNNSIMKSKGTFLSPIILVLVLLFNIFSCYSKSLTEADLRDAKLGNHDTVKVSEDIIGTNIRNLMDSKQNELRQAQHQLDSLQTQLDQLSQALESSKREIKTLRASLQSLQEENNELKVFYKIMANEKK